MGLTVSHGAFDGAYSAFNRFRQFVMKSIGGNYPPHKDINLSEAHWYFGDGYDTETHPGLTEFFRHSDCDGYIEPEMCSTIANELKVILPLAIELEKSEGTGGGHIAAQGGYVQVLKYFIEGCEEAYRKAEQLEFR